MQDPNLAKRTRGFCFTIYPDIQADLPWDPQTIDWNHFKPAVQFICCQLEETPSTGRLHWQGAIEFKNPTSFQNARKSFLPARPHLEIRKGTAVQSANYCRKSESCIDPDTRFEYGLLRDVSASISEVFRAAIHSENYEDAVAAIADGSPRDYILYKSQIERNLKEIFCKPEANPWRTKLWEVPLLSKDVLASRSIVLCGGSNLGKTCYAFAHFIRPLKIDHIDDLKKLKTHHDGIIFDDMSFEHWPPESCIHILDLSFDRTINVRYGTATIPAGLPRIFTTNKTFNTVFNFRCSNEQQQAMRRRSKIYNVRLPLWKLQRAICSRLYRAMNVCHYYDY
jgi:hypothetical protein